MTFEAIKALQAGTFKEFQKFFNILLDDLLVLLGPAPCRYDIRAKGSVGRREPSPKSDLEIMILIDTQALENAITKKETLINISKKSLEQETDHKKSRDLTILYVDHMAISIF